jgi:hydroxypyruvate isomerase
MPRFAANLTMMFTEVPFLDRFGKAAEAGFEAVEFLFPYDFDSNEIAERLKRFDLTRLIERMGKHIGHVQIASVPLRNEPDAGETNYPHLYETLDKVGYKGWIGCEYNPRNGTEAGLGWFQPYRRRS